MTFTVEDFPNLLDAINTHPEWRYKLVEVLFPDVDLAQSMRELKQALKELAQAQARTEQSLKVAAEDRQKIRAEFRAELAQAQARNEQSLKLLTKRADEAAEDRRQITARLDIIHNDVADLKGESYENAINDKAAAIFGRFIRRGKDIRGKISEQLYKALDTGKISDNELDQVIAVDLLWGGVAHPSGLDVVLVIEASWRVDLKDLERAVIRAKILRTLNINAIPVVAGKLWDKKRFKLAIESGVAIVEIKRVNKDTWDSALRINIPSLSS